MTLGLTTAQITLIKTSFSKVLVTSDQAASLFYGRLFEIAPETQALFHETDMASQGVKLMQKIWVALGLINAPEKFTLALQTLGQRHAEYGVTPAQYDSVGAALLWTLEQQLGDDFTNETRAAWEKVYSIMAETARDAAYDFED